MIRRLRVVALVLCASFALAAPGFSQGLLYSLFERYIDSLRQQIGIPGMSAVLVKDGQVVWERGFGHQDMERSILATSDTPYPIGGLTQSIATVVLGNCAESGRLDIDDPMSNFVVGFPAPTASVRRVMAHASDTPIHFRFDRDRFGSLSGVADGCTRQSFRTSVADDVLDRLGMAMSVPGFDLGESGNSARGDFDSGRMARYADVLTRMAVPYRVDRSGRATRSDYTARTFTAADGIVSTVQDLARFDAALDDGVLLKSGSLNVAWSQANFLGTALPTGLGWFVQFHQGERLVWQFSEIPGAYSGLILKMPARRLTLIMLANSDGLSQGANLDQGDVTASPFVKIFLRLFF